MTHITRALRQRSIVREPLVIIILIQQLDIGHLCGIQIIVSERSLRYRRRIPCLLLKVIEPVLVLENIAMLRVYLIDAVAHLTCRHSVHIPVGPHAAAGIRVRKGLCCVIRD